MRITCRKKQTRAVPRTLTITIPKKSEGQPKKIQVQGNAGNGQSKSQGNPSQTQMALAEVGEDKRK